MSDYDEYGLKKPHKTYMEKANDWIKPGEDAGAAEQIGRALAAAPLLYGAHFADILPLGWLSPFGVEGNKLPGLPGEIHHGQEVEAYNRRRAEFEGGPPYLPSEQTDYSELGPGECSPEQGDVNADGVPFMLERPREQMNDAVPTYQWMAD